jgi:hypothetical protein
MGVPVAYISFLGSRVLTGMGYRFKNTLLFVSKYRVHLIYFRDSVDENVDI